MNADLSVEVVYARPHEQLSVSIVANPGATVRDAIERSGLLQQFPDMDLASVRVGIYGKRVELETLLRDGDRVEIYRPLTTDAKLARRRRASRKP